MYANLSFCDAKVDDDGDDVDKGDDDNEHVDDEDEDDDEDCDAHGAVFLLGAFPFEDSNRWWS